MGDDQRDRDDQSSSPSDDTLPLGVTAASLGASSGDEGQSPTPGHNMRVGPDNPRLIDVAVGDNPSIGVGPDEDDCMDTVVAELNPDWPLKFVNAFGKCAPFVSLYGLYLAHKHPWAGRTVAGLGCLGAIWDTIGAKLARERTTMQVHKPLLAELKTRFAFSGKDALSVRYMADHGNRWLRDNYPQMAAIDRQKVLVATVMYSSQMDATEERAMEFSRHSAELQAIHNSHAISQGSIPYRGRFWGWNYASLPSKL